MIINSFFKDKDPRDVAYFKTRQALRLAWATVKGDAKNVQRALVINGKALSFIFPEFSEEGITEERVGRVQAYFLRILLK